MGDIGVTVKRLATDASVAGKDIIKNSDSLLNAVNHKTKIHLAVMTEEYIRTTLLNQQIETLLEDVHTLPGTLHIHRVKEDLQGKIITGQCKSDECSIIYPWKHFSSETAIQFQKNVARVCNWSMCHCQV